MKTHFSGHFVKKNWDTNTKVKVIEKKDRTFSQCEHTIDITCSFFTSLKIICNLLYDFYKTPFCCRRVEHDERSEECYKASKCDKIPYKTSVIHFFCFAPILNFEFKKKFKT
jgi:hypothetical protein